MVKPLAPGNRLTRLPLLLQRKGQNMQNTGWVFSVRLLIAITTFSLLTSTSGFAQQTATPTDTSTVVGCLTRSDREGFFNLREEGTGFLITVTNGGELEPYSNNNEVRLTGRLVRQGGMDVFQVENVERLATSCQVNLNVEGFRRAVGRALYGVHGGIGFDHELIYVGAHAQIGPVIRNLWLRPNYEFGIGEVTKTNSFALHFSYFLPVIARESRNPDNFWNFYVGAGPAFHLTQQDFDPDEFRDAGVIPDPDEDQDFGDWDSNAGLDFFFGMASGTGFFAELKAGAYGSPPVRFIVGWNFR
jgi:hypothetical protein